MKELTKREEEILKFIKGFMLERGYAPSHREIGHGVGLASVSAVHTHFMGLVNKGYITQNDKRYSVLGMRFVEDAVSEVPPMGDEDN